MSLETQTDYEFHLLFIITTPFQVAYIRNRLSVGTKFLSLAILLNDKQSFLKRKINVLVAMIIYLQPRSEILGVYLGVLVQKKYLPLSHFMCYFPSKRPEKFQKCV